jgi:hypothetical protein
MISLVSITPSNADDAALEKKRRVSIQATECLEKPAEPGRDIVKAIEKP